jgi:hypothetical protein
MGGNPGTAALVVRQATMSEGRTSGSAADAYQTAAASATTSAEIVERRRRAGGRDRRMPTLQCTRPNHAARRLDRARALGQERCEIQPA